MIELKVSPLVNVGTEQKVEFNDLIGRTISACEKYGAFEVRKAAIRQMRGDSNALEEVALHNCTECEVLVLSNHAFSLMTDDEKQADYMLHYANNFTQNS